MTPDEARRILARRPDWVRRAGCVNVGQYISTFLLPRGTPKLLPGEDLGDVADELLAELNRDAARRGEKPIPVSAEEITAYLIARGA